MSTLEEKIEYNKRKATKYGWTPELFGVENFDGELVAEIKRFQREEDLTVDGMCGPATYRRRWTQIESGVRLGDQYIIYNDARVKIFWDNVICYNEPGGKKASRGNFSSYAGKSKRNPNFFVTHWDVCLSADSCFRVLERRGISVHYSIDNDGTIYQWLDMQHAAWHAGGRSWNHNSVGVEVSNAYSLKYQSWYVKKGFGGRPVVSDAKVHGKTIRSHLGFYDVQLKALAALWEAVSYACGIPLELPGTKDALDKECANNNFSGFCNHYHLTQRKIDCAGLNNEKILELAKRLREQR